MPSRKTATKPVSSTEPGLVTGGRIALCLYGMIGTWEQGATELMISRSEGKTLHKNASIAALATFSHRSIHQHIVTANRADGMAVDVFLHSWNPEVGSVLDRLYSPVASQHQPPVEALERVRSSHLSMMRVLALLRMHETPGAEAQLVMVCRYDIVFFRPVLLRGLHPTSIWLPHFCTSVLGLGADASAALARVCGSDRGDLKQPPYAQRYFGRNRMSRGDNYNSMVLDYFFIASPAVAETFSAIYRHHDIYQRQMDALYNTHTFASHFFWTHHINRMLRSNILPDGQQLRISWFSHFEIDFNLARFQHFGSDCLVETDSTFRSRAEATLDAMRQKIHPSPFVGYPPALVPAGSWIPRNLSWLVGQCPASLRSGHTIQCPWYSPRCDSKLKETVRALNAFAGRVQKSQRGEVALTTTQAE